MDTFYMHVTILMLCYTCMGLSVYESLRLFHESLTQETRPLDTDTRYIGKYDDPFSQTEFSLSLTSNDRQNPFRQILLLRPPSVGVQVIVKCKKQSEATNQMELGNKGH